MPLRASVSMQLAITSALPSVRHTCSVHPLWRPFSRTQGRLCLDLAGTVHLRACLSGTGRGHTHKIGHGMCIASKEKVLIE
jgi:hypothetical protein